MAEKPSVDTEYSRRQKMYASAESVRDEMMDAVKTIAGARQASDSIKTLIVRAALRTMMPVNKIKRYWYGEISVIPAHEADYLRIVAAKSLGEKREALQAELNELKRKLNEWQ